MVLRRLIPLAALAFALAAPAARADADPVVRVLACSPWQERDGGAVTYQARMRSRPGTARMALRFRLLEKSGDGEYRRVGAREGWRNSRPGALSFVWEHRVRGLRQGAVYRAVVHYRWFDKQGRQIASARRRSAECRQDGGLPNLRVVGIDVRKGDVEETATYRVTIANRGDAPAAGIGVLLRVDGEVVDEAEVIEELKPGARTTVTFSGPICRDHMRVVVDPKNLIAETREEDNARAPTCL